MAFDGPGAFDGDPAYIYVYEIEGRPPGAVRAELHRALTELDDDYIEVDEGVWAWAAAELVAHALGRPSDPPPPTRFTDATAGLPDPAGLVAPALAALDRIVQVGRSEIAALWAEGGDDALVDHLAPLRARLRAAINEKG